MKKPSKRRQPPTPHGQNGNHGGRFDRKRVGNYLRILFELHFVERQLGVAGLPVMCDWLPDGRVFDLIEEQVFAPGEENDDASTVIFNSWYAYREYFGTREAFNPKRFVDWLEAGNFDRVPFPEKPRGLWTLPYEMPVV
jgi:hypothetical protein